MKLTVVYIGTVSCLLIAVSSALAPSAKAEPIASQPQIAPLSEPYEPGSSAVINDWHFTPGEKTTIATNFRSHHHRSAARCRNSHHHHSST